MRESCIENYSNHWWFGIYRLCRRPAFDENNGPQGRRF